MRVDKNRDAGKRVELAGWVFRRRDHGGLIFVDLRDVSGVVQVVFSPEIAPEVHGSAHDIKQEYVIRIEGEVSIRPAGTENPTIPTGAVEVLVSSLEVLNTCKPLPFQLEDEEEPNESLRLRYRYLDMRRPKVRETFIERSRAAQVIRSYLVAQGFLEIDTPFLGKSTPEGARDFIIPSRLNQGQFYALPQSPQLFKQILMVGGFDKYFQIARCFRDEDLRADRQPEFTQVDLEMSFVEVDDVLALSEGLINTLFTSIKGTSLTLPVRRMDYTEAMERYGSDKPDLRFDLPIEELTPLFQATEFGVFKKVAETGGAIKGLALGGKTFPGKTSIQRWTWLSPLAPGDSYGCAKRGESWCPPSSSTLRRPRPRPSTINSASRMGTWSLSWQTPGRRRTTSRAGSVSIWGIDTTS